MQNFVTRLIWLLVLDVMLTVGYTYTPANWTIARDVLDGVILIVIATTMLITFRRVLEDY